MEPLLLNKFPPANKAAWRAQVQKDLKDEAAPDSLRWQTESSGATTGFTLEPYYTAEDLITLPLTGIQAAQKQVPGWLNTPERRITEPRQDNLLAKTDLTRGADALVLDLADGTVTDTNLSRLLNGIKLSDTPVFFRLMTLPTAFTKSLQTVAPYQLKGGLLVDPIARWLQTGLLPGETLAAIADATKTTGSSPQFRTICGSSQVFHNAGATATQELAFLFSSLADQYDTLTGAGLTIDQLIPKTLLSLPVGTTYFIELAKLRALRVLWYRFLSAYQRPQPLATTTPFIHAQTSVFYDSVRSPYTNLLRATTEAMAAVIGGCDALTVHPYNTVFGLSTKTSVSGQADREFTDRIARNVSVLLTEESYLNKVADPSAGSYYVETLTHELVEAAWALFLRVDAMGGLQKAAEVGFVQTEINQAYQTKAEALKNGRIMVGVNKFQTEETLADNRTKKLSPTDPVPGFITLLTDRRLAGEFEN